MQREPVQDAVAPDDDHPFAGGVEPEPGRLGDEARDPPRGIRRDDVAHELGLVAEIGDGMDRDGCAVRLAVDSESPGHELGARAELRVLDAQRLTSPPYFDARAVLPSDLQNPANSISGAPTSTYVPATPKTSLAPRRHASATRRSISGSDTSYGAPRRERACVPLENAQNVQR